MQQKKSLFSYFEPISVMNRPGPTRPWRSLMSYFSKVLKYTNLKVSQLLAFELSCQNLIETNYLIPSYSIFLRRRIFVLFTYIFGYNSRTTKYFQNLIISRERKFEDLQESL